MSNGRALLGPWLTYFHQKIVNKKPIRARPFHPGYFTGHSLIDKTENEMTKLTTVKEMYINILRRTKRE